MSRTSNPKLPLFVSGLLLVVSNASGFQPDASSSIPIAISGRSTGPRFRPDYHSPLVVPRGGGPLSALSIGPRRRSRISDGPGNTIPSDTSITTKDDIPSESSYSSLLSARRNQRPAWLRYLIPSRQMLPEITAEAFGTFILLQLALGIVLSANFCNSMQGVFPIAILTGCAITAACAAVASKCAAHFNPAITWSMCLYRNFGWHKFVPYCGAQLLGATAASLVNYVMYAAKIAQFEATNGIVRSSLGGLQTAKTMACYFGSPITPVAAFFAEAFGTFALTSVVFALTSRRNDQAKGLFIPPIVGATVALIISIVGPISCASLNPAREIGPRLILKLFGWSSGVAFSQIGLYLAAAMTGATAGGWFIHNVVYPEERMTPSLEIYPDGLINNNSTELAFQ